MSNNLVIIILTLFLAAGCVRTEPVKTADIDPTGWRSGEGVRLVIDNADTLSRRDLTLLFRFDNTFRPQGIPLAVRVTTPDSLWYEEVFTAVPDNPVRSNNDFYEAAAPYRNAVVFTHEGRYVFEITNAGDEIGGIWGLGMIIE